MFIRLNLPPRNDKFLFSKQILKKCQISDQVGWEFGGRLDKQNEGNWDSPIFRGALLETSKSPA